MCWAIVSVLWLFCWVHLFSVSGLKQEEQRALSFWSAESPHSVTLDLPILVCNHPSSSKWKLGFFGRHFVTQAELPVCVCFASCWRRGLYKPLTTSGRGQLPGLQPTVSSHVQKLLLQRLCTPHDYALSYEKHRDLKLAKCSLGAHFCLVLQLPEHTEAHTYVHVYSERSSIAFKTCQTVIHACNTITRQAEAGRRGSVAVLEYIQSSWLARAT